MNHLWSLLFNRFYIKVFSIVVISSIIFLGGCKSSGPQVSIAQNADKALNDTTSNKSLFYSGDLFHQNPPILRSVNGVGNLIAGLNNVKVAGKHYCLRSYNGQVPGPTVMVPRQRNREKRFVRLNLVNNFKRACLAKVESNAENNFCRCEGENCYDFNSTNLHTHGLHVSPDYSPVRPYLSDHVLMKINWNNARAMVDHGGAPLPIGACRRMAGGYGCSYDFAVDDGSEFVPGRDQHEPGTFWYHAHVHGTTAIQVANGMAGAFIIRGPVDDIPEIARATEQIMVLQQIPYELGKEVSEDHICDPENSEDYSINAYGDVTEAQRTLINGRIAPIVRMQPGEVQRWRLIHGGITQELQLSLEGPVPIGTCRNGARAENTLPLHQIAADGITLNHVKTEDVALRLDPGYRSDVMVKVPETIRPGNEYCLIDKEGISLQNADEVEPPSLVAVIEVAGLVKSMRLPISRQLHAIAKEPLSCDAPVDGTRKAIFSQKDCPFFSINCKSFPDAKFDLTLGETDKWDIGSDSARHPFHIHVNPFTVCTEGGVKLEHPYWRDTLLIDPNLKYETRSRYLGFTGAFVLHCHRLNHEDQGMMGLVNIGLKINK